MDWLSLKVQALQLNQLNNPFQLVIEKKNYATKPTQTHLSKQKAPLILGSYENA